MSEQDEWSEWSESWHRQPVADVRGLQRQVKYRRWRMISMVALEALTSLVAMAQTVRLMHHPILSLRWRIFCVGATVLVLVMWAVSVVVRRGTWRASGDRINDLLRLTERRARSGIRLARAGLWGLAALVVFAIAVAWPQLQPASWLHDPKLRLMLLVQISFNGPVVMAIVAFNLWYMRRQRLRLIRIAQLMGEQDSSDCWFPPNFNQGRE